MQNVQTLKGFRDFLPKEERKRQYVLDTLKKVFESYGFEPLETPALEYEEILTGKYGDEGDKLMYKFTDNGDRKVAMRYDQTVPLARVVAQYQNELSFPFKRYQIQNVWRAENTQKGRYREFLQVDADIVGSYSPLADTEIISLVTKCLEKLGFNKFKILINDRSVFKDLPKEAVLIIDKLSKIGQEEVQKELKNKGLNPELLSDLKNKSVSDLLLEIKKTLKLFDPKLSDEKVVIENTLARGLDYYTGVIFEVQVEGYDAGSIAGGGRYDNLIGMFTGRDIPAVGFSFGFDRLIEAMEELNLFPKNLKANDILVAFSASDLQEKALNIANKLRERNINAEIFLDDATLEKQLKYADKKQIPFVVIQNENGLVLKEMVSGEQKEVTLENLPDAIKS